MPSIYSPAVLAIVSALLALVHCRSLELPAEQPALEVANIVRPRQVQSEPATVTVTDRKTTTVFVTTSATEYAYQVSTITVVFSTTQTTYVPAASPSPRRLRARASKLLVDASAARSMPKLDIRAETTTTTVEENLTITSFVAAPVTTFMQTVSSTSTATVTLAAPTFAHVHSAAAGCQGTFAVVAALQLDNGITDKSMATDLCQEACMREGRCRSLFVQHLFEDYGGVTPVWKCSMSEGSFDVDGIICDLSTGIWGAGEGFDAVGRGVA